MSEAGKLRAAIAEHLPEIIGQLVTRAIQGDVLAAKILLEKALPPLRPVETPVQLPWPADAGLTEQAQHILQAVAGGILAPGQGAQLLSALGTLAHLREIDELANRIKVLESRHEDQS